MRVYGVNRSGKADLPVEFIGITKLAKIIHGVVEYHGIIIKVIQGGYIRGY